MPGLMTQDVLAALALANFLPGMLAAAGMPFVSPVMPTAAVPVLPPGVLGVTPQPPVPAAAAQVTAVGPAAVQTLPTATIITRTFQVNIAGQTVPQTVIHIIPTQPQRVTAVPAAAQPQVFVRTVGAAQVVPAALEITRGG